MPANITQPLTDVFSSQPGLSPSRPIARITSPPRFTVAVDDPLAREAPVLRTQIDSGYHGSTQDEMEMVPTKELDINLAIIEHQPDAASSSKAQNNVSADRRTTEGSFHSAKEEQTTKVLALQSQKHIEEKIAQREEAQVMDIDPPIQPEPGTDKDFDDIGSPSDESTPDRPLIRKSSLNFASLPAREPLKSNAESRMSRLTQTQLGRLSTKASTTQSRQAQPTDETDDSHIEILGHDESEPEEQPRQYRSTQRLHEKIDLLGKAPPLRVSKSIPSLTTLANSHLRQSEAASKVEKAPAHTADDEDDWIKPLRNDETRSPPKAEMSDDDSDHDIDLRAPELIAHEERMRTPARISPAPSKALFGHAKSHSTATLVSPSKAEMVPPPRPAKSISVSNPAVPSTTPQGSPKRMLDGTLSASKSKLHSIMRTAKGLFSSSAGVSAAAKLETLSPNALRMAVKTMPGLYPNMRAMLEDKPLPASPREGRNTRSSTEKQREDKRHEKQARAMQKMDEQLEKAREKEAQKAAQYKESQSDAAPPRIVPQNMRRIEEDRLQDVMEPANPQASKPARTNRPIQNNFTKPKPVPVSIKLGTLSQRVPVTTQSLASNLQETLPAEPKRPGLTKKVSNTSLQSTASTAPFKTSVAAQPSKPKALIAAERKREQDEREAQRKLEHKKEMERRRAAQQEEAKRQEQKQRGEAERKERERIATEQAKRQVQQQAIERKRLENARKAEQQRIDFVPSEAANRPPSRLGTAQPLSRSLLGHPLPTNPAKPAKRPMEEEEQPKARPMAMENKRRKTEDENEPARPIMSGAPIRQSNLGNKKTSIFNHNLYAPVHQQPHVGQFPQPPGHPRLAHASTMAQYGNGAKIPFAEAPNPPVHASKTPASAHHQKATLQLVKSSPQYPHGEAIHLPEIPTDSEDEDSENEGNAFPIPDWATPGHLTDQLIRQEGVDGDAVFGPIAPLKMEEIFAKGNKERLKRMRDRTSSANWAMSGDGLTLEEIRADREQRERMRLEGGWRYGPQ